MVAASPKPEETPVSSGKKLVWADPQAQTAAPQSRAPSHLKPPSQEGRQASRTELFTVADQDINRQQLSIGRYKIIKLISHGGMGSVYQALDPRMDRLVALKVCRTTTTGPEGEADLRRFHSEVTSIARLTHPSIVHILDSGSGGGIEWFVMDFIDGTTLGEWVRAGPQTPETIATVMVSVARAMQHAHENGVLHRDLKPANILIDSQNRPFVTDFGLAQQIGSSERLTMTGEAVGTPHYMSPEQALGRQREICFQSDVWGLGTIMYEALTKQTPFHGENAHQVLRMVVERDPIRPSQIEPSIPRDLETITLKCLEKSIARRYVSCAALADDLERFLRRDPIEARPPSLLYRLRKRTVKHRMILMSLGAILVLLSVFAVFFMRQQSRERADWLPVLRCETGQVLTSAVGKIQFLTSDLAAVSSTAATVFEGVPEGSWIWCERLPAVEDWRVSVDLSLPSREVSLDLCLGAKRQALAQAEMLPAGINVRFENRVGGSIWLSRMDQPGWPGAEDRIPIIQAFSGFTRLVLERDGGLLRLKINDTVVRSIDEAVPLGLPGRGTLGLRVRVGNPEKILRSLAVQRLRPAELSGPTAQGDALANSGHWAEAAERYWRSYEDFSRGETAAILLAKCHHSAKQVGDEGDALANQAFDALATSFPKSPARVMVLSDRAIRLWNEGRWLRALDEAEAALKLDPTNRLVQRLLAQRPPKLQPFVVKRLQELLPLSQSRLDLDLSRMELGNLDFLKGCKIDRLDLSGNPVADLSPLIGSGVQILNVAGTKITSLEQIQKLPIVVLDCSSTLIASLDALRGSGVVDLNIAGTKVADLTPISKLSLRRLRADRTPIRDTRALMKHQKLRFLSLAGCSAISLVGLPVDLEELDISFLSGSDLASLAPLVRLRKLSLVGLDVQNCPFANLTRLESLDVSATGVSDLAGLAALPLRHLRLAKTKVTEQDLKDVASSEILESLDLSGTNIENLEILRGMKKLSRLNLAQTKVTSLAFAAKIPLEHLDISGTAISDLSALRGLPIRSLVLSQCPVRDCTPLSQARLVRLDAAQSALEDLSPLQGQPLVRLDVHGTRVRNLGNLSGGSMQLIDGVGCALSEGNFDRAGEGLRMHCDPELAKGAFLELARRHRVKGIGLGQGLLNILSHSDLLQGNLQVRGWMAIPRSGSASEASLAASNFKAAVLALQDPAQARRLSTDLAGARVWVRIGREDVLSTCARDPEVLAQVSWSTWSPETLVILSEGRWRLSLPGERAMVLIEER